MNGGGKPPPYDKEKGIIYMYLHLGNDHVVKKTDIVGIFDLDNSSQSKLTRDYLSRAEKEGRMVIASGEELPKSFVVCRGVDGGQVVYLSLLNSSTLLKRNENTGIE